jgi:hypothetical protein
MKPKLYNYDERREQFEEAVTRMVERICNPVTREAIHFMAFLDGTYFQYGHSYDYAVKVQEMCKNVPARVYQTYTRRISRMASRYKVAPLHHFNESGEFKTKALEQKYYRLYPIG